MQKGDDIGKEAIELNDTIIKMTYEDFLKKAKNMEAELLGRGEHSISDIEDITWNTMCTTEKPYGTENVGTLFADDVTMWNLDRFTIHQSNIHGRQTHHNSIVSLVFSILVYAVSPVFFYHIGCFTRHFIAILLYRFGGHIFSMAFGRHGCKCHQLFTLRCIQNLVRKIIL